MLGGSPPGASSSAPSSTKETGALPPARTCKHGCCLELVCTMLTPADTSEEIECRPDLQGYAQRVPTGEPPIIVRANTRRPLSAVQVFRNLVQQVNHVLYDFLKLHLRWPEAESMIHNS